MPRLPPSLVQRARFQDPLLPLLLRECRDLPSARNELRWLKEHVMIRHDYGQSPGSISRDVKGQDRHGGDQVSGRGTFSSGQENAQWRRALQILVERRAGGEPLQYILGSQPFGDLEILCERGVLIPRPETEAYTLKVARLVEKVVAEETVKRERRSGGAVSAADKNGRLRVLDVCTGTGCIPLLLYSLLGRRRASRPDVDQLGLDKQTHIDHIEVLGIDNSPLALDLARRNLRHNVECNLLSPSAEHDVSFLLADALSIGNEWSSPAPRKDSEKQEHEPLSLTPEPRKDDDRVTEPKHQRLKSTWDILISNPPYISPKQLGPGINALTARSVRKWEPISALVPPDLSPPSSTSTRTQPSQASDNPLTSHSTHVSPKTRPCERGDEFYEPLLRLAEQVRARLVVLEVGDTQQGKRVKELSRKVFSCDDEKEEDVVVELWRDEGFVDLSKRSAGSGMHGASNSSSSSTRGEVDLEREGEGEGRAVVIWRGEWAKWREKNI